MVRNGLRFYFRWVSCYGFRGVGRLRLERILWLMVFFSIFIVLRSWSEIYREEGERERG